MRQFERALGIGAFEVVDHPLRGSRVARARIGESWLVLVCPYDPDSAPGRHLAEHGEGFFLISFGFSDADRQLEHLRSIGIQTDDKELRNGILDWRIADIGTVNGVLLQMTDDARGNKLNPVR